ncbi:MAG: hypothetical protein KBD24_01800 [Candidatus Pacebacteria bacterium]|nr:hypothetical protein [Candidatus Paceibacterota bacterium]
MNETWKITLVVIITVVIVGGGMYYWQNSKILLQAPVDEKTSDIEKEMPNTIVPTEQHKEEMSTKTTERTDDVVNWKTHSGIGVTIKYPDDGTYIVNEKGLSIVDEKGVLSHFDGFTIGQNKHPGFGMSVHKTNDSSVVSSDAGRDVEDKEKVINGNSYKVFFRDGMGYPYGYIIERNGQFYVFECAWGPENEIFELVMATVRFE